MRYHYCKPKVVTYMYGEIYICNHPIYDRCTLYKIHNKGLAVIQQRYRAKDKSTYWSNIDDWIVDKLYLNPNFKKYFEQRADICKDGIYPTVTVRQIMWALRMKPLKKYRWETTFDRKNI